MSDAETRAWIASILPNAQNVSVRRLPWSTLHLETSENKYFWVKEYKQADIKKIDEAHKIAQDCAASIVAKDESKNIIAFDHVESTKLERPEQQPPEYSLQRSE